MPHMGNQHNILAENSKQHNILPKNAKEHCQDTKQHNILAQKHYNSNNT